VLFADDMPDSAGSDLYSTLRSVISDRSISSVGGFATVVSNWPGGFRFSVYSDMLYDWPEGKPKEYEFSYHDKVHLTASGENAGYSIAQLSPGYIGMNVVAYYFVRTHSLFLFFGPDNGVADLCRPFRSVEPDQVVPTLNQALSFDGRWLAMVTSAHPPLGNGDQVPASAALGFFSHLNTFPKSANPQS
jgi:hypothetical protein